MATRMGFTADAHGAAKLGQDREELLIDFPKRCGGISGFVHPEAPVFVPKAVGSLAASGGSSSVGRAAAFQAACREFEPRLPLHISVNGSVTGAFGPGRLCCHLLVLDEALRSAPRFIPFRSRIQTQLP